MRASAVTYLVQSNDYQWALLSSMYIEGTIQSLYRGRVVTEISQLSLTRAADGKIGR